MPHLFSQVPRAEIPRSRFKRDHTHTFTCDAGVLVPFLWDEILPGDSFNVKVNIFARMSTLISPIMDDLYINTFYFFIPNRLIWDNWQRFMGEQPDGPDDSIDYVVPHWASTSNNAIEVEAESICDYMGMPLGSFYGKTKLTANALPLRAYYSVWNNWFRDENLQDAVKVAKGDTYVVPISYTSENFPNGFKFFYKAGSCLPICKVHDYFSSSLPWPAKPLSSGASITVPLGGSANVFGNGYGLGLAGVSTKVGLYQAASDNALKAGTNAYGAAVGTDQQGSTDALDDAVLGVVTKAQAGSHPEYSGLVADLTSATGITINQLRESMQIQKFMERSARGGTRYTEIIRSMFGIISPDSRLQRPEYLGGSCNRININVVPQTSASEDGVSPQANLAAFATGTNGRGDGFVKSFTEHGILLGLMAIRGPLVYQQGLNRMWSRKTRFDYYWPVFSHLGEQAVLRQEIYANGTKSDNETVWGYQERYAEYRYFPNMVSGKFRSTYSQPLDSWHLGMKFDSAPQLNNEFIQEKPPISRIVAVPDEPAFLVDTFIKMDCARPIPLYGVPGLVDHF